MTGENFTAVRAFFSFLVFVVVRVAMLLFVVMIYHESEQRLGSEKQEARHHFPPLETWDQAPPSCPNRRLECSKCEKGLLVTVWLG